MRTIDYTTRGWGHNLDIRQQDDGTMRGFCWSFYRPRVGDQMIWRTEYGTAVGRVTDVRPCMDPADMYGVTLEIVERRD